MEGLILDDGRRMVVEVAVASGIQATQQELILHVGKLFFLAKRIYPQLSGKLA